MRCLDVARATVAPATCGSHKCSRGLSRRRTHHLREGRIRGRIVRLPQADRTTKSVGIDGDRLLLAIRQQKPDCRFLCGFRWHNVPLLVAAPHGDEHRQLVLYICSVPTWSRVVLAAFQASRDVEFVNFDVYLYLRSDTRSSRFRTKQLLN